MTIYVGVVEDRDSEPNEFKLTRYRVRISGVHSPLLSELSVEDLPWAIPIQNNSAAMNGMGHSATGYLPGSTVIVIFADENKQIPLILGAIAGIQSDTAVEGALLLNDSNVVQTPTAIAYSADEQYVGALTATDMEKLASYSAAIGYPTSIDTFKTAYAKLAALQCVTINTPKEKLAGILLSTVVKDVIGTYELLGELGNAKDDLGTTVLEMYKKGYLHFAGKESNDIPSLSNISSSENDNSVGINISSGMTGFKDPSGKYPLPAFSGESDVSRLARGENIKTGTIVGKKQERRTTNVKIANSETTWDQPNIPYSALYPNNNVYESIAGHVLEFDDTPHAERVHLYHNSGSFLEIDTHGNKVDQTVSSRTIVVNKDDFVHIKGDGHVTIDGGLTLRVEKALNVEIVGNANIKVKGNVAYDVDGDFSVNATKAIILTGATVGVNGPVAPKVELHTPLIDQPAPVNWEQRANFEDEIVDGQEKIIITPLGKEQTAPISTTPDVIPTNIKASDLRIVTDKPTNLSSKIALREIKPAYKLPDGKHDPLSNTFKLSSSYSIANLCPDTGGKIISQHGLTQVEIAKNLQLLSVNALEPIKAYLLAEKGQVLKINSGFRTRNKTRNYTSEHEMGMAADLGIIGNWGARAKYFDLIIWIKDNIPFSQLIMEYQGSMSCWIHIAYNATKIKNDSQDMKTIYTQSNGHSPTTILKGGFKELAPGSTHKSQ